MDGKWESNRFVWLPIKHRVLFSCVLRKWGKEDGGTGCEAVIYCMTVGISDVIHIVVCITTWPYPLPKRDLNRMRSSAFSIYSITSFPWGYPVAAYVFFIVFRSLLSFLAVFKACFRRQFLRKMWQILLAFPLFVVCRYSFPCRLYVTLFHFSHDRSIWSSPSSSTSSSRCCD
jgi:hypothetical protein